MTPRKKRPRAPSPPPVVYPRLPCVGGPKDGEWHDAYFFLADQWIAYDAEGIQRVVSGAYVRLTMPDGGTVYQWRETRA